MLRIRFGPQDLGRVRLAPEPDPFWEMVLSLAHLEHLQPLTLVHDAWRVAARRATSRGLAARARELLGSLVPLKGDFPDFLTPVESRQGFDAGLEAIRALPARSVRDDLMAASDAPTSSWARALGDGDRDARSLLDLALREYFKAAVEPHWPVIRRQVVADQAARSRQSTTGGVDQLLSGIGPAVRWSWPVLEADYPHERTLELRGRGLVLIPSFFCRGTPVTFIDPELPPILVYPAAPAAPTSADVSALANVFGRTRAQILVALEHPRSTTELATRISMSVASASHHVGLLREAGLVDTTRTGISVRHQLTRLGYALLDAPGRARGELPFKPA